jgi:hypothetical protein
VSKAGSADTTSRKRGASVGRAARSGHGPTHVIADTIWMVLARRTYDEALRDIGTVAADDPELAKVYARTIFDEFAWIEMVVVPRSDIVPVIDS